jgi:hypothetical protein
MGETMNAPANPLNDDMPEGIDFSSAVRGKFYRPDVTINRPVYLDAGVPAYLTAIATKKRVPLSDIADDLLASAGDPPALP